MGDDKKKKGGLLKKIGILIGLVALVWVGYFGYAKATALLSDPWFNTMAQNANEDGCKTLAAEEKALVNTLPAAFNGGFKFVYPAVDLIDFRLKDAHDPLAQPPDPPYAAPTPFVVPITCTTTFSPLDQVKNGLTFTLTGTVL